MATFHPNTEAEVLAKDLIAKYHTHLQQADIAYLFTDKSLKQLGKPLLGKAAKASPILRHFSGHDFIILFPEELWSSLNPEQRKALVDHELCHCGADPESGGVRVVGHDVEEFYAIIERHGFWQQDLQDLAVNVSMQLELLEERHDKPVPAPGAGA